MNENKSHGEKLMPGQLDDHDLLIQLSTKVDILIAQLSQSTDQISRNNLALVERVTALENKDSRDSEKVQSIRADVQRSLDNASKVDRLREDNVALTTKVSDLEDEVNRLRSKNTWWDIINSVGFVLSGILGYVFGNK